MTKIDTSKQLEDFTREEWKIILEKGCFRGKHVHAWQRPWIVWGQMQLNTILRMDLLAFKNTR